MRMLSVHDGRRGAAGVRSLVLGVGGVLQMKLEPEAAAVHLSCTDTCGI